MACRSIRTSTTCRHARAFYLRTLGGYGHSFGHRPARHPTLARDKVQPPLWNHLRETHSITRDHCSRISEFGPVVFLPCESSKGFIHLGGNVGLVLGGSMASPFAACAPVTVVAMVVVGPMRTHRLRYELLCARRFVTHRNRLPLAVSMIQSPCPVPVVLRLVPGLPSWSPRQRPATTISSDPFW